MEESSETNLLDVLETSLAKVNHGLRNMILEKSLAEAHLPAALSENVRRQLDGRELPRYEEALARLPVRLVIDNYPADQVEYMDVINNPEDASAGTRKLPFSNVLYIEQDDFREDARMDASLGLTLRACIRRTRQHRVFGRDPAESLVPHKHRHAVLDRGSADHPGIAKPDQHGTLGVAGVVAADGDFPQLRWLAATGSVHGLAPLD